MAGRLKIQIDEALSKLLQQRAKVLNKTASELAQEILQQALIEKPLQQKISRLKGKLRLLDSTENSWRAQIRQRNWRS